MKKTPMLIFTEKELPKLLKKLAGPTTVFVTDAHNEQVAKKWGDVIKVQTTNQEILKKTELKKIANKIVGIGGCTALDVGRFLARKDAFIAVPTILSNSCISVDRSVLQQKNGDYQSVKTKAPQKTYICLPKILGGSLKERKKWYASGFGDLFSNIAACIENTYQETGIWIAKKELQQRTPFTVKTLQRILRTKEKATLLNKPNTRKLAQALHDSSIAVIKRGNAKQSAGSEHKLYYSLQKNACFDSTVTTHGIIVSIGTLCTIYIHAQKTKSLAFFNNVKAAYKKVGLPTTKKELEKIGITKSVLMNEIEKTSKKSQFYKQCLLPQAESVLKKIYGL